MKKINIENYARIAAEDPALLSRLYGCADPRSAMETVKRSLADAGYELVSAPDKLTSLSDDALGAVTGGASPFIPLSQGEINPYSWFVSFLRLLMGLDGDADGTQQKTGEGGL